jgi:hypothetical protein
MATAGTRLFSITLTVDQNGERLELLQSVGKCAPSLFATMPTGHTSVADSKLCQDDFFLVMELKRATTFARTVLQLTIS